MRGALALPFAVALALGQREASAQVRWDTELQGGIQRRVLTSKPPDANDAGLGPTLEASGHVALIPLIRVGLYAQYDSSNVAGQDTRQMFSGGLDARLLFPWPQGDTRLYARVGIGEAATYAPLHRSLAAGEGAVLEGAWGNFTEVPLALGFAYRVSAPVWLTAEAGARFGFACSGDAYRSPSTSGDDTAAVYLDVGVMWGR